MSAAAYVAAAGIGAAVWCALPEASAGRRRLAGVQASGRRAAGSTGTRHSRAAPEGGPRNRLPTVAAASAGLAVAVLLGGGLGVLVGLLVAAALRGWLSRLEPVAQRRRRERLEAAVPVIADLVGACVGAGRPLVGSARAAAECLGPAVLDLLGPVTVAADLGADPVAAWTALDGTPLEALGRTLGRCGASGASPVEALRLLAEDARAEERARANERARRVGSLVAAPLGLCFLPAFVLVGVVPLVGGLAQGLLG